MSAPVTLARIVPPVDSYAETEHNSRILQHNRDARPWATMHRAARLASDLTAERATSAQLADRCLDLGRELEALRDAVRAHEASVRAGPRSRCWDQADLALWAAAKVTP